MAASVNFTNITNNNKTFFVEDDEFSTECPQVVRMLWGRTLGDEFEGTKFICPGCHHHDGK